MITIAVQTHNFQHRLNWMLSSLVAQEDSPKIVFDIASLKDNGTPTTEQVIEKHRCKFFPNLRVYHDVWDDAETFQYRGNVRNAQIARCDTQWLLFADTDMVYHPQFFNKLIDEITPNHYDAPYMLIAGRYSNPQPQANELLTLFDYPCIIPDVWQQCDNNLDKIKRGNVGAGFFQLINMEKCPHSGFYVKKANDGRWFGEGAKGQKGRTDMAFRRRVSRDNPKRKLPEWFSQNQIHLNHQRDNEFKYHLEIQR